MENDKRSLAIVSSDNVTIKKKPFTQKFKEAFISQDFKTAATNANNNVFLPAFKRVILDVTMNILNNMLFGSSNPTNFRWGSNSNSSWSWNGITYSGNPINYATASKQQSNQVQTVIPSTPGRYNYNDIIITPKPGETMADADRYAEDILLQMRDMLDRYGKVSINDFLDTCGLPMDIALGNYGWTNLRDMDKVLYPGQGYWIKLPVPTVIK